MSKNKTATIFISLGSFFVLNPVFVSANASQVEAKLQNAGNVVQSILTGLVVLVGVCVALFVIIKRLPQADNPHEKNEVYQAVGRVAGLVALAAAVVWLLPWVYGLFV